MSQNRPRFRFGVHLALLIVGSALNAQEASRDPITDLVNVRFQEDVRVFTVMAALNAAGFDYEREGVPMSPLRADVRRALERMDIQLKAELSLFYRDHSGGVPPEDQHVAYTSLALILSGPPAFSLNLKEEDLPGDTWRVKGFQNALGQFYEKAGIAELWERHRPRYQTELQGYLPVLRQAIRQSLEYFRVPARVMLDRQIILIPDLLNARDIVNARNLERVYYIVVGPTDDPSNNLFQLQHEYLHSLVDPLISKFGVALLEHDKLLDIAQRQPHIRSDLQNQILLIATESLIEAIQLRMRRLEKGAADRELVELFREGLVLAPYFERSLAEYEQNQLMALPAYLDLIFQKAELSTIRKDEEAIAKLESAIRQVDDLAHREFEERNQEIRRHNRRVALLNEVNQALSARDLAAAEAKAREMLLEFPEEGAALFYLGQVSSQTGRYAEALDWYRRATESTAEPRIKAWAFLRMGRIAASQERFEEARQHFESVLSLDVGRIEGADQEARKLIELLPPKN